MAQPLQSKLASIFKGQKVDQRAATVEERYLESHYIRRKLEGTWFTNIAFYRGNQWVTWNNRERKLTVKAVPKWKVRMVVNRILPTVQSLLSLLVQQDPKFRVVPTYSSDKGEQAARAGTAFLQHQWERDSMYRKVLMARLWALVTGRGFMSVLWDPDAGEDIEVLDLAAFEQMTREGQVPLEASMTQENPMGPGGPGGPMGSMGPGGSTGSLGPTELPFKPAKAGRIRTEVVSPFAFHMQPTALSLDDAQWCMLATHIHRDTLREQHGSVVDKVASDSALDYRNYERRLLFDFGKINYPSKDLADLVVVKELWERPSEQFPEGRYLVVAGGQVLEDKENIYRGLPFIDMGCYPSPGSYWDEPVVTHLRPLQVEYNRARSNFREIANLMGKPKWLAWRGSGLIDAAIDDQPGEIIEVDDTAASFPQRIDPPPPPAHYLQLMELDLRDMDDISGVNDAMRGSPPAGVKSGKGLAILQEGAMSRQSILMQDQSEAMKRVGRMLIMRARQFYDEERMVRITGLDNMPEVYAFSSPLAEMCYDVEIQASRMFPYNKIARMEMLMEMWVQGLIVNKDGQRDPRKALDLFEFGDTEKLWAQADIADRRYAELEIQRLMDEGTRPELKAYENHYLHADIHRAFLLSYEGRAMSTEKRQVLEQHLDKHIEIIAISERGTAELEMNKMPVGGGAQGSSAPPGSTPTRSPQRTPDRAVVERSGGANSPPGQGNQVQSGPPRT